MANNNAPVDTPLFTMGGRLSDIWRIWFTTITTVTNAVAGALLPQNNLSDLANVATARTNLGLGSAATHVVSDFDPAGAASAAQAASLQIASNLSDLASAATARTNLGLGSAATHAVSDFDAAGTASAAVAAIPNASATVTGLLKSADWSIFNGKQTALGYTPLSPANNLSDLASAATARTNLGLGSAATANTTAFDAAGAASALLSSANTWASAQTFSAAPKLALNSTGAGSAALGANCPAVTATAPYTWIKVTAADGSTVFVPAWK